MSTEVALTNPTDVGALLERVLIGGDLSKLNAQERLSYYRAVCESVGLNPLTKPFDYITLQGKLTLYAKRDATDQLRKRHGISIRITERSLDDDVYVVRAQATEAGGRTDESTGAVSLAGLKGEARANAMMKAETKSKRRVTLSICGLGMLDETEIESMPDAAVQVEQPRAIVSAPARASDVVPEDAELASNGGLGISEVERKKLFARLRENGRSHEHLKEWLGRELGLESTKQLTPAQYKQALAWAGTPAERQASARA